MLQVQKLQFKYNIKRSFRFPDFAVEAGEHLLVLGKSGSGKTTLLHLLAGFLKAESGLIALDGEPYGQYSSARRDAFRKKHMGLVFQKHHFIKSISVLDNILLAGSLAGKNVNTSKVLQQLALLGIGDRAKAKPAELSQGELQRASIVRAIIHKPQLVLADEPTSALDDESCSASIEILSKVCTEEGAALVVVTHDQRLKDYFTKSISL